MMQYVFAAVQERVLSVWRSVLAGNGQFDLRRGYGPETAAGCDAVVMAAPLAHDRYGGKPSPARAQVLVNERGDGLPRLIVAMPAVLLHGEIGPPVEASGSAPDARLQNLVLRCLEAVDEFSTQNPDRAMTVLEFSIDGMMIPDSMQEQAARATLTAIQAFGNVD